MKKFTDVLRLLYLHCMVLISYPDVYLLRGLRKSGYEITLELKSSVNGQHGLVHSTYKRALVLSQKGKVNVYPLWMEGFMVED